MSSQSIDLVLASGVVESEGPNVPSFSECFRQLRPFFLTLERGFESATQETREYFDRKKRDWDPFFAPHQVRYLVKEFLRACDLQAEEFDLEELAYSGLSVLYQDCHIKIFKSIGGEVPPPGPSKPRRRFYAQQESFFAALARAKSGHESQINGTVNLIVLWDFDKSHRLSQFWLVCPKAGGNSKDSVEWHWHEPVPHLLDAVAVDSETEPVGEDLPITKKQPASVVVDHV